MGSRLLAIEDTTAYVHCVRMHFVLKFRLNQAIPCHVCVRFVWCLLLVFIPDAPFFDSQFSIRFSLRFGSFFVFCPAFFFLRQSEFLPISEGLFSIGIFDAYTAISVHTQHIHIYSRTSSWSQLQSSTLLLFVLFPFSK